MAGNMSNYLESSLLQLVFGSVSYSVPSSIYVGLWTTALDDDSDGDTAGEVDASGYERVEISNDSSSWDGTGNVRVNAEDVEFPTAEEDWGIITYVALLDAATSGNVLFWAPLTVSKTVSSGDTLKFTAGNISITAN